MGARHQRSRWVVVVTALDNGQHEVFGPFTSLDRASKLSDRLRDGSDYYAPGAELGSYQVQIAAIQPWRSMRAFAAGT